MRWMAAVLALALAWFAGLGSVTQAQAQGTARPAASESSAPSGGGSSSDTSDKSQPLIDFQKPVVFTLALGGDAATNARISVALANKLKHAPDGKVRTATTFVPEGQWNLGDFTSQCRKYPTSTWGAFIVLPPSASSRSSNYLIVIRSEETLTFNAMVAVCNQATGAADVEWVSDTATGQYGRSVIQFLPLAVLTSVYLAFAPSRTYTTVTSNVFPVPSPIPKGGAQSSVQTTATASNNSSGTATLQNNVVSSVGIAALLFGRQSTAEDYTVHSAEDAVTKLVFQFLHDCAPPNAGGPYCAWQK
jgi:hypothetical protein